MVQEFLSSWPLFQNTYLVGWMIAVLLALNGFLVVSRNQIFYGAAVSQSSTFGVAVGLLFTESPVISAVLAIGFSIVAALFMMKKSGEAKESLEALTGFVFLAAASFSILLVSHSPHSLEEVHRLQASSIIGATHTDVIIFCLILVVTIGFIVKFRSQLLLFAMDQEMARSVGISIRRWSLCSSVWLGLVIGLCIRSTGMLYTFGCLVLPGLAAKSLSKELGQFFVKASIIAFLISFFGFILANAYDFPPAQLTIGCMSVFLAIVWLRKNISLN